MTRVLIVDDHPLVARATANEVRMVKRDAETRLAHSIEEAERVIAEWEEPDTILLDLRLPDTDGLSGLVHLHKVVPKATIAIISAEDDPNVMRDAFAQGARGYLTKGRDIDQFTDGLRKVLDYGFYFPPEVTTPAPPPPSQHLTDREEEVVRALGARQGQQATGRHARRYREHVQDAPARDLPQARRQNAHPGGRPGARARITRSA